jgi:polar amino acid transport system substrate-binding protein
MNKFSTFLLIYFLSLALPSHAIENNLLPKSDIAMLTIDQMPYGYTSNGGKSTGVFYDILNEIMILSDIKSQNVITPSKRIYNLINSNTKICLLAADSPLLRTKLDGIEPINYFLQAGILPKKGVVLSDYSNLKGLTIAVPLGINVDDKFHNDKELTKVFPSQYLNAIKMLKINRVDAVAGAISTLKFIAKLEGMKEKELGSPLIFAQYNINLFCSNNILKKTRSKLKQAVITLRNKGRITEIFNNYFNIEN